MSVIVDAHQHFWRYQTYETSWMEVPPHAGDPLFAPIRRSFEPPDLLPELQRAAKDTLSMTRRSVGSREGMFSE
jgi:predicted TIM-barrel fold metal-dependent hydrolase